MHIIRPSHSNEEIKEQHRKIMKQNHPDHGGSTYLAAKINEAMRMIENKP